MSTTSKKVDKGIVTAEYSEYMRGTKDRKKHGILVYSGNGFDEHAVRYLRDWGFTTHIDDLAEHLTKLELWDGFHHTPIRSVTPAEMAPRTAPQRSNLNGQNAECIVENNLRSMGYRVVRGVKFGRDEFRRKYKWDFVAFTDQVEIYVEVKSQDLRGSMQDKISKTCHSIRSISIQYFD